MSKIHIDRHPEAQVAVLTLDHERENRLHPELLEAFATALDDLEGDDGAQALVVTGADTKFFSNGLELNWLMQNAAHLDRIVDYLGAINALFARITLYPKPIVAALNGHTFAAGVFLSAHMDFRFMREDRGWVCLPESDINIPLLPGMIQICEAVMTPQGFRQMYYTGRRFTAPEALAIGFVDEVHPEEALLPAAIAFASALGKKKTRTYAEMKRRIRAEIAKTLTEVDPGYFLPTLTFSIG
ncbi:MAG: enoyl-CoA hydratase/isomerase family protein [Deltaproteobacteria bacterium]|nr:enoyl-CoA hydratase/isomerase family protein [Deltaproteobacteria bacterium]